MRRFRLPVLHVFLVLTVLGVVRPMATPLATDIRVVSYNIKHGRGNDNTVDLARTAQVLRELRPDVVGLQEVDRLAERSGKVDEARALGETLGLNHAFGKFMDFQGGGYGLGVLSRFPITRSQELRLLEGNEPRVALAVDVRLPDGRDLTIVNVHFDWVRDDGFRFAQAQQVAEFLDALTHPYVLLGDFNDEPGSRTLGLFTTRAAEAAKPPDNRLTFSSTEPAKEIDFIFMAPRDAWTVSEVRVIDEKMASDHRPLLGVLSLR